MHTHHRATFQRGQWSLIGMLVSLAIIVILSAWYYTKILKPQMGSHNGAPAAEQKAYGAVCSEYQSQLNQASMMYKQEHNDRAPQSFDDLKKEGATEDIIRAPGCQFQLDAGTGTVTEIGHGQAAMNAQPVVVNGGGDASAPAASSSARPAPPAGMAPGPGGINVPTSGSVPANSGGEDGQ